MTRTQPTTRSSAPGALSAATLVVIALTAALPASAARREPLRVYCEAADQDGFVDPELADSLRDLRDALRGKKKTLRLVETRDEADLVARVEERLRERVAREPSLGELILTGASAYRAKVVKAVYVSLEADGSSFPVRGSDDLFWQLAAEDAAGRIDRWLKQNRERLLRARPEAAQDTGAARTPAGEGQRESPAGSTS